MKVYLVVMYAVYEHGSGGIFTTREAAEQHAQALLDDSDWHHAFIVTEIETDVPLYPSPRQPTWRGDGRKAQSEPDPIGFEAWSEVSSRVPERWERAWTPTDRDPGQSIEAEFTSAGVGYLAAVVNGVRCIAPLGSSFQPNLDVEAINTPVGYVVEPFPRVLP